MDDKLQQMILDNLMRPRPDTLVPIIESIMDDFRCIIAEQTAAMRELYSDTECILEWDTDELMALRSREKRGGSRG